MIRTRKLLSIFFGALLTIGLCCSCSPSGYATKTQTVFSSGLVFSASVMGGKSQASIDEMLAFLDEADVSLNMNRTDSLISKFNGLKAGEKLKADKHLFTVAKAALELYRKTDGAFNPALNSLSEAWNVDANGINRYAYGDAKPESLPEPSELNKLASRSVGDGYECLEENGEYYLLKSADGLELDFGGIAKGYCVDVCRDIALNCGVTSALIKISGNVMLIGDYFDGKSDRAWGIGVINPRKKDENSARYVCGFCRNGDVSVVTSGDYERCYDYSYDGGETVKICHIIDGSTKMPLGVRYDEESGRYKNARSYVISATVMGEKSMIADAYSTAVCVLGLEKGAKLLADNGYDGIIFTSDGKYKIVGDVELSEKETLYINEYEAA